MLLNFFTLRALAREWNDLLDGATLADAYTQDRGSMILVFERAADEADAAAWSVNISVQSPNRHLFLYEGTNRARRNTVDVFEDAVGLALDGIGIADRDRIVTIRLEGAEIVIVPFGPRANVFLRMGGEIVASFRGDDEPPEPRRAPDIPEEIPAGSANDVSRALPMFSKSLAREVIHHLQDDPDDPDPRRAADVARRLEARLLDPDPVVYWDDGVPELLSMTRLAHLDTTELRRENFAAATEAVRVVARRRLGLQNFVARYEPLKTRLEEKLDHTRRSLERVREELDSPSRADRYETWGHLLMAQPHLVPSGAEQVEMDDMFEGTGSVTIELDPAKSAIENAQAYYNRARRTRKSRENAERRLAGMESDLERLSAAVREIRAVSGREDLEAFESRHAELIDELRSDGGSGTDFPYRRYVIHGGYEVWVGRNARQNDQLTLRDSRKYDLWLHARGVPGSHTVLRVKGRKDSPPKAVIEQAAAIAAYHSKARTSSLAPVMVTERKYVRKPRNAHPGAVVVEREEVLMVEPGLP